MHNIKIVIGSNFGDEGKGITTDYYCKQWKDKKEILNIRFNGGSQAGHTVVCNGKRHIFHNFGAGSFNKNVTTFLSSYCYIEPINFLNEKEKLKQLGILTRIIISSESSIILPFDIFINQIVEKSRGQNNHGSCGLGIWECLNRNKIKKITPLVFKNTKISDLKKLIISLRDTYYADRLKQYGLTIPDEYKELWFNENIIDNFIVDTKNLIFETTIDTDKNVLNKYKYQVFEGAQGLLLDWDNEEYMPNLTASHTGLKNVEELISIIDDDITREICYVTRTYFTRHGKGKFLTETKKENLRYRLTEKTNIYNEWQENFRWGFFDLELFKKTIEKDLSLAKFPYNLSLSITHCDETNNNLILKNKDLSIEYLKNLFNCNLIKINNEDSSNL